MDTQKLLLYAFLLTILLSLLIGAWGRRRNAKTVIGFFWGDNSLTVEEGTHLNLSTSFAINGVLYSAWLGYIAGWVSILPQVIWCAGYLFLSRYSNRLSLLSRTGTLHGNIGYVFGKGAAKWAAIASLVGFTLLFGWELYIGSGIFKTIITFNSFEIENFLYFSLAGICAIYCMVGGLRGNLKANEFQNYLSGIALVAAIIYLGFFAKGTQPFSVKDLTDTSTYPALVNELTISGIIVNIVLFTVYQFLDMSVWQNIAALSAEKKGAKKALWSSAFWILLFPGVTGTALGMVMRSFSGLKADTIIPALLQQASSQPVIFFLLIMGFFAMMLSTVDGLLLAACQATTWDLTDRKSVLRILTARSNPNFDVDDIIDLPAFSSALTNSADSLSKYLLENMSDSSKAALISSKGSKEENDLSSIVKDLNKAIQSESFYSKERFSHLQLSAEAIELSNKEVENGEKVLLNRWILEDAYPGILSYNQFSHTVRKEKAYSNPDWKIDGEALDDLESKVLYKSKYAILLIAIVGGFITLAVVRKFGVDSFNLLYIAYVAQMALFPAIWSILHGKTDPHPRAAYAIALGLIVGFIAVGLGLKGIVPWAATWAPVIAISVACLIHWPFRKLSTIKN